MRPSGHHGLRHLCHRVLIAPSCNLAVFDGSGGDSEIQTIFGLHSMGLFVLVMISNDLGCV